ncbi:copper chaperone PCu(A)C [Kaarinaea lacus]
MLVNNQIKTVGLILLMCLLAYNAAAYSDSGMMVKDAWVREAPPNAKVLAAYMTIENHTAKEKILVSVTSEAFNKIEIHKTINKGGMATMEQQKELAIATHGKVTLEPGGLHLMLFNPGSALKAGDNVTFTLKFADGSTTMITANVKKATGGSEHHHHGGHDDHSMHEKAEKESKQDDAHQHHH